MAKAKSKDFILKRDYGVRSRLCDLCWLNGTCVRSICYEDIKRYFGIKIKPDEKKRVRITMKVVKK